MESPPFIDDDEVIADSEGEETGLLLQVPAQKIPTIITQDTIHASAQAQETPNGITQDTILTALDPTRAKQTSVSTIDDTTTASSSAPKPRPKPRPLKKPNAGNTSPASNLALSSDFTMDLDLGASNIADRAKMRSRATKSQSVVLASDIIELSSDNDDDFSISAASKPKRKSAGKAKPKSKPTAKSKLHSNAVDTPDPKPPRPRPRLPKKKQSEPASPHPAGISQDTSHIPTSSLHNQFPIPFKLLPSQLPPSDPPTSTSATHDLPHIETLPYLHTDQDPPSSPSSLFSISSSGKNKRNYERDNVDELDSSQPGLEGRMDADMRHMPPPPVPGPPPTFFAGSSSPAGPDASADLGPSTKKASAARKSRKKKIIESDDEDDPLDWGANKPKAKPKAKKTHAKKVEVIIERPKAKAKGKEKQVFTSREFIDDEDDEADDLNLMDATTTNIVSATKPDSLTSLSSVSDSDIADARVAGLSKKRKSVDREDDDDADDGGDGHQKRRATGHGKGKRMIVSDDDDEDMQIVGETPSSKETPTKRSGKEKGKQKEKDRDNGLKVKLPPKPVVVDSDEDAWDHNKQADEEYDGSPRTSSKENIQPLVTQNPQSPPGKPPSTPAALLPSLSSRYTIAPKTKSTPMSDLIRRVNSKPGSPFCSPAPRASSASSGSGARPLTPGGTAYSPYVKSSRSALSRIAPLHPNRRTPPPPLPPPPPKKKTKKELEREEQWEEELVESVGGITEWACMSDAERREMRRAKREREMAGWED